MSSKNVCNIMGHVGKEPEMRFTPNGTAVTNFSVAVNRNYTKTNGEKITETEWFNVVTWGKTAESCNQFVSKGMLIDATGRVQLHQWENTDGQKLSRLQLNATSVIFLNKSNGDSVKVPIEAENYDDNFLPDDIPF